VTEYQFDWKASANAPAVKSRVSIDAQSRFHGAAIALREFVRRGYDIAAPLAQVDMTEPSGETHILLVEEVRDWLKDPRQAAFVRGEDLAVLLA
jgi:hypothetical protein